LSSSGRDQYRRSQNPFTNSKVVAIALLVVAVLLAGVAGYNSKSGEVTKPDQSQIEEQRQDEELAYQECARRVAEGEAADR
jgi:hypothetical protein